MAADEPDVCDALHGKVMVAANKISVRYILFIVLYIFGAKIH
jgi:hypothetical protein